MRTWTHCPCQWTRLDIQHLNRVLLYLDTYWLYKARRWSEWHKLLEHCPDAPGSALEFSPEWRDKKFPAPNCNGPYMKCAFTVEMLKLNRSPELSEIDLRFGTNLYCTLRKFGPFNQAVRLWNTLPVFKVTWYTWIVLVLAEKALRRSLETQKLLAGGLSDQLTGLQWGRFPDRYAMCYIAAGVHWYKVTEDPLPGT